jgi:hypothetical protein
LVPSFDSRRSLLLFAVLVAALGAVYLRWTPPAPDLAAQVARANVVRDGGIDSWWTGWFGGLSLPSYSVLVPSGMAFIGVGATGVIAVVVGAAGTTILTRLALRPRAGALAFALSGIADLLDGRVTFTAGLAFAAWTLVATRSRRSWATVALAVGSYLASPLAGLFLGLILLAIVVTDRTRRRAAALGAGSLLLVGTSMALFFPGTGTMPFRWPDAIPAALACAAVAIFCSNRLVRAASGLMLLAIPLFLVVPGAVGANITRLAWVCAVPVVIACAPLPRRFLIVVAAAVAVWPIGDLAGQLHSAASSSAQAAYYRPLQAELELQQSRAGATAIGQRVEVVDTANHWGSAYLSTVSLARGWDRQADHAYNPIFYDANTLTAATYQRWLNSLAVGWVALPAAPLDYASVAEGSLIRSGLNYLQLAWSTPNWRLYRVVGAQPLLQGAEVRSVDSSGVVLTTAAAEVVRARIRWSPYLTLIDPASGAQVPSSCVLNADGWVNVVVPRALTVELSSHFDASTRLATVPPVGC